MHVILQQLGIVIQHLLEVRHHPALIDGVAMKPAAQLVVHSAPGHLLERHRGRLAAAHCPRPSRHIQQQINRRRMGKLGLRAKPSVMAIELFQSRRHHLVHDARLSAPAARQNSRCTQWPRPRCPPTPTPRRGAPPGVRHGEQHAPKTGPAVTVAREENRSPEKRRPRGVSMAVSGHRPVR